MAKVDRECKKGGSLKAKTESKNPKNVKSGDFFELRLYVAGQTPKSIAAFANLRKICEANLKDKYRIEVIDLLKNPQLAKGDRDSLPFQRL